MTFFKKMQIVFTEGTDSRILEASSRLLASSFLHPILVGNPDEVLAAAEETGFNIRGAEIIDPTSFDRMDEMVEMFLELRKGKGITPEEAKKNFKSGKLFWHNVWLMGYCRCTFRRCYIFNSRYCASGASVN